MSIIENGTIQVEKISAPVPSYFVSGEYFAAGCQSRDTAQHLLEDIENRTGHNGLRVLRWDEALPLYPRLLPISRAVQWTMDGVGGTDGFRSSSVLDSLKLND